MTTKELFRTDVEGADEPVLVTTTEWRPYGDELPTRHVTVNLAAGTADACPTCLEPVNLLTADVRVADYPKFRAALLEALDAAARAGGWEGEEAQAAT